MPDHDKARTIHELAQMLQERRVATPDQVVVHCHGVFDLLHIGHIRYLQKARQLGDKLIVTVTPDRHVNKGPHRPAFQDTLRVDALAALDCVDYVAINEWPTACEAIELLKPDVYAKGAEFRDQKTPELKREEAVAARVGARVEFIDEFRSSSSHLLNRYLSPFAPETEAYLQQFRSQHTAAQVMEWLERCNELKVLVVGEAIIDEYYACGVMGQSAKAPILAARYESHERFGGGSLAVANHLVDFAGQVDLLAMLGTENTEEAWLRSQSRDEVGLHFFLKQDSPTIVKRRYRDSYFGVPLFAVNFLSEDPLAEDEEAQLLERLNHLLPQYDVVIVTDYGHQMLSDPVIQALCEGAKFLAVNTQSNAANTGYHTISKYVRADYASLADRELRLECRSTTGDVREQLQTVGQRLYAGSVSVTQGKRGSLSYSRRHGFHTAPSLATNIVDRVGAGDAFFAITSLLAAVDSPLDILGFLGNVAGAEAVSVVGNSRCIEGLTFRRHVESLFK